MEVVGRHRDGQPWRREEGEDIPQAVKDYCTAARSHEAEPSPDHKSQAGAVFGQALELSDAGEFSHALRLFSDCLWLDPHHTAAHFNMGALLQMLGQPRLAVYHMVEVVQARSQDATAHSVLGSVLYGSEPAAVVEAYRSLVRRQPENVRAAHQLACLTGEGDSAVTAAPAYVREVFDHLADTFEDKLVNHLNYRVS